MRLSLTPIRDEIQSALRKIQEIKRLNDQNPESRTPDLMHIRFDPAPLKAHLGYLSNCTSGEDFQLLQELTRIADIGEVVIPCPEEEEFKKLFSELQKLTEIYPDDEMDKARTKVESLKDHISQSNGAGELKVFPCDNLDEIVTEIKDGKAVMINLAGLSNIPDWDQTVIRAFYAFSEKLAGEFNFSGGQWPIFEALKNAFLHGNDLDCQLPIFLSLSTDDGDNVTSFEIYDIGEGKSEDVTEELKRMIAILGQVGGYGMGSKKIQTEWGYTIKPEAVKDDSTRRIIGTKYVYAQNDSKL